MPHRTNPFQELTATIMATVHAPEYLVEESVIEVNEKTGLPREIDIRITEKKNPDNKILVECRDHKRKQDVTWIDSIDGKARSLGARRVIAVSSSGFYETAVKEAEARGIETLHLTEAEETDWKKWLFSLREFGLEIVYPPAVKHVKYVIPEGFGLPDVGKFKPNEILIINPKLKGRIRLKDALEQIVNDPKVLNYIKRHNIPNAIGHYDYEHTFHDGWRILTSDNKSVPLLRMVVSLDSKWVLEKVRLTPMKMGDKKLLVGEPKATGPGSRLVMEERPGQLWVTLEQRKKKPAKKRKRYDK